MDRIVMREARAEDLPVLIAMLADDQLGQSREEVTDPVAPCYVAAFEAMARDPNNVLAVAEEAGRVLGTLQVSYLPGLARRGAWRGQIEAVRVAREARGRGLGEHMMLWAIGLCRARGCALVQLTSDASREGAHRFYDRLGFKASHVGFKLFL